MISRNDNGNFLVRHYDWIAAGVSALALVGAVVFFVVGSGVEDEIADATSRIEGKGKKGATVGKQDMNGYRAAVDDTKARERAKYVLDKATGSGAREQLTLFASDYRLMCTNTGCLRATTKKLDDQKNDVCAFCGMILKAATVEVVKDGDRDGMPDNWEIRFGLNPKDPSDAAADKDGDGFTNLEEYIAKTDPADRNDHPDYLDSLALTLPLEETYMPFIFTKATKIPSGWRCEFFDAKQKDDYGRPGRTITAVIGEEIGKSGFVLKSYAQKESKVAIKGGEGLKKSVDVSEATVTRKSDGKQVTLVIAASKKAKPAAVDVQAKLTYTRGEPKNFNVVPGSEIDLNGSKYKIREIKRLEKGARVVLESSLTGKKRTVEALER